MARREIHFIDYKNSPGQPNVYGTNHEKDDDSKPTLIQYLEGIEFDPELENFYPEVSNKEDCICQHSFRDNDQSCSGPGQKCRVCVREKRRYPGFNERDDCCPSRALFTNYDLGKEENENAAHDVIQGVENSYSEYRSPQYNTDSSLFLLKERDESLNNHISDLGLQVNYQIRKNVMVRDKEGCEASISGTEKGKSSSRTEDVGRRERVFEATSRPSKTPSRCRIEVNSSNRGVKPNRDQIEVGGDKLGSVKQSTEILVDGLLRRGKSGNNQCDERNGIVGDENRIMNEVVHRGSLANLRECDRNKMPVVGTGRKNRISIGRQTESNMKGSTWCARQREINSVKPIKKPPQVDDDANVMPHRQTTPCVREREGDDITKSAGEKVSEQVVDIKCMPRTHLSVINGVSPVDKYQPANDRELSRPSRDLLNRTNYKENDELDLTKAGDSTGLIMSKRRNGEARNDSSSMEIQKDFKSDIGKHDNCNAASKYEVTGIPVVKPTRSQYVNVNGFKSENNGDKSSRTKQSGEAQPESIVISIDSNDEDVDGNCFERKNKWMIEIVDRNSDSGNIGFTPSIDTPGIQLAGDVNTDEQSSKKGGDPAENKKSKTIECLGDHNPVFENRRLARKSIEKGLSQKCIVYGDLQEKVNDDLSSSAGKMWRKNAASNDTVKQSSTSPEKSKLIYQGQGVQLRLNIKKPTESLPNAPKNEQARAGDEENQSNKVVSTSKAVSLKSTLKSIKTEGKFENGSGTSSKRSLNDDNHSKAQDTDVDLNQLDQELVDILNYEPPQLELPVIGKGHVEFGLKKACEEDSLKMENARLSRLLLEVEQARSTTVKALLSANSVLHKVNDANTELEGALKTLRTDKKFLELELEDYKEKLKTASNEKDIFSTTNATEFESSMKVIISSWKKEKQELLSALAKSSLRVKRVEADAEGLRVAFQRVKDQLENSNSTFSKLLEHNLQASVKIEEEMKGLKEEKVVLYEKIQQSSGSHEKIKELEEEIVELRSQLEASNDEKEELYRKIGHLEKKNRQVNSECEELQEQLDHSQEIVDKLAEKEEELKEQLEKETSEKEYLQDCLDETGQILLHLRNNEKKLLDEKGELEEDLEEEMQVNESLQQSLKSTMKEHQQLVNRYVMNKFHFYHVVTKFMQSFEVPAPPPPPLDGIGFIL